ncbi:unnamed protein product [Vitrella brassicaformis CCMP3155]|uniref:Uncharacterized protein n=1 Tax=Vitrella brassicaformis (strain CCMP3155) TaxID=1169540 RepID=A0A0G4EV94_VITBC|nr:unnamed protein product [Vitrella brassicaformis CCMP3155]|eukprot:CEM02185.1 unnamed protein product [Vitrella brassicaformis CCMP3155]
MPHKGRKGGAHDERTRECRVCGQGKKMLFRCKWRKDQRQWDFVCRVCWPSVSGAESSRHATLGSDGMALIPNTHYRYGGTWKAVIGDVPPDD